MFVMAMACGPKNQKMGFLLSEHLCNPKCTPLLCFLGGAFKVDG